MTSPAIAAIKFALQDDEPKAFLDAWLHGDFDVIRREWPEAPESVFAGADPLHSDSGEQIEGTPAITDGGTGVLAYRMRTSTGHVCEGRRDDITTQHWQAIVAAIEHAPDADRPRAQVRMNGNQLLAALEFVAPDYPDETSQLTDDVVLADMPAGTFTDGSPREAGIYCCMAEDPQEGAIRLEAEGPCSGLAHCIGCGCDDLHACSDRCWWLRVDYAAGVGVCSNCAAHVDRWDQGDRAPVGSGA